MKLSLPSNNKAKHQIFGRNINRRKILFRKNIVAKCIERCGRISLKIKIILILHTNFIRPNVDSLLIESSPEYYCLRSYQIILNHKFVVVLLK